MKDFFVKIWAWIVALWKSFFEYPEEPEEPNPEDTWPDWIKQKFGDWDYIKSHEPVHVKESSDYAFWQVTDLQCAVWEEQSSAMVQRKDESWCKKIVFDTHTKDQNGAYLNVGYGKTMPGYRSLIPTNVEEPSQNYADSEKKVEIFAPKGCVVRPRAVKMLGYLDKDTGKWTGVGVDYPGL